MAVADEEVVGGAAEAAASGVEVADAGVVAMAAVAAVAAEVMAMEFREEEAVDLAEAQVAAGAVVLEKRRAPLPNSRCSLVHRPQPATSAKQSPQAGSTPARPAQRPRPASARAPLGSAVERGHVGRDAFSQALAGAASLLHWLAALASCWRVGWQPAPKVPKRSQGRCRCRGRVRLHGCIWSEPPAQVA